MTPTPTPMKSDSPESAGLQELRVRRDSPSTGARDAFQELKDRLVQNIAADHDPAVDMTDLNQLRPYTHERMNRYLEEQELVLNRTEKRQLLEAIVVDLSTPIQ